MSHLALRESTMKYACTFSQLNSGDWCVRHVGSDVGTVEVTARSQQAALEKMRGELHCGGKGVPPSEEHRNTACVTQ